LRIFVEIVTRKDPIQQHALDGIVVESLISFGKAVTDHRQVALNAGRTGCDQLRH
jgi:hypothetical protein